MFERFTEQTRHVMVLAQDEARRMGHPYIGTEHLLVGLVRDGEGTAAEVLGEHGVTLEALRAHIDPGATTAEGGMPFTPQAKRVLEQSLRESSQLHHGYIGPEHLLLAIVEGDADGVAARLLAALEVDPTAVRAEVLAVLEPGTPAPRRLRLPRRPKPELAEPVRGVSQVLGPVCPHCFEPLTGRLEFAALEATAPAAGESDPPLAVTVVYCFGCGAALGVIGQ